MCPDYGDTNGTRSGLTGIGERFQRHDSGEGAGAALCPQLTRLRQRRALCPLREGAAFSEAGVNRETVCGVRDEMKGCGGLGGGYEPACGVGGWWLRVALPLLSFSLKLPSLKALYHFFMMK